MPALNSEKSVGKAITSIRNALHDYEILVADGGSHDNTQNIAESMGAVVILSPKGRGTQMMEGFKRSKGDIIIFMHSDTWIAPYAGDVLEKYFVKRNLQVAKFSLKFDNPALLLRIYACMAKVDSFWTSFGDQGIVINRNSFEAIGGFPCWPLLEDVCIFQKARRKFKIHTLPIEVVTSANRFLKNGLIRQQFLNLRILIKYLLGFSVHKLSLEYEKGRTR